MDLFANFVRGDISAGPWAREREAEGWTGVSCADHVWLEADDPRRGNPHVFTTLATMAAATDRVLVAPAVANNLLRSPVEFVHAMLTLQSDSGGRAEAALGAGWFKKEVNGIGWSYPDTSSRAGRFREAMQISRQLLDEGECEFDGRHYQISVPKLSPRPSTRPPLVAAVGGAWTIRNVAPIADKVELTPGSAQTESGMDWDRLSSLTEVDVKERIAYVREFCGDIPLSIAVFVAVGDHPLVDSLERRLGESFHSRFVGSAPAVADSILQLRELGFSRVTVTEAVNDTIHHLAESLFP